MTHNPKPHELRGIASGEDWIKTTDGVEKGAAYPKQVVFHPAHKMPDNLGIVNSAEEEAAASADPEAKPPVKKGKD